MLGIAISPQDRPHLAHQQPGEHRARQQDDEELHQADEEFLGVEVYLFPSLSLGCRALLLDVAHIRGLSPNTLSLLKPVASGSPN